MGLRTLADIRMRDPFVLRAGHGQYVLFGTTDENLWGGPGTGFDCYTSSDLEHWDGPIAAFRPPSEFWGTTQFWAPEVHAHDGRYFMFATFAAIDAGRLTRGTASLVADSPTGPFHPWSEGPLTPSEQPCLDGTLYIDGRGDPWLVYSRGAEGTLAAPGLADGEMCARRLTHDLKAAIGNPIFLFRSTDAKWSRPLTLPPGEKPPAGLFLADEPYFTDGAFLVRVGATLFMLWSSFGERGYAMGVACSPSGDVLGPWQQSELPLWPHNGGHGMIFADDANRRFMVFHTPNETPNERVRMVAVSCTEAGIFLA